MSINNSNFRDDVCDVCGVIIGGIRFGVSRQYERIRYLRGAIAGEVDVVDAQEIAVCCSSACRNAIRGRILSIAEIRETFPDIGPVEICSRCGGPVEMTKYHLSIVEDEAIVHVGEALGKSGVMGYADVLDSQVLAVACEQCAPHARG